MTTTHDKAKWSGMRVWSPETVYSIRYQVCFGQCVVVGDEGVVAQDTGHLREVPL